MAAILMGSLNATAKDYHYTTVAGADGFRCS